MNDDMHWKRGLGILRFEKSQWVEFLPPKKNVDFRLLAEALWREPHVLVAR